MKERVWTDYEKGAIALAIGAQVEALQAMSHDSKADRQAACGRENAFLGSLGNYDVGSHRSYQLWRAVFDVGNRLRDEGQWGYPSPPHRRRLWGRN